MGEPELIRNPIPSVVDAAHHHALLYGNLIGGLDLTVAKANNNAVAWNTVTVGSFLAQCQRKWDTQSGIYQRFVEGIVN